MSALAATTAINGYDVPLLQAPWHIYIEFLIFRPQPITTSGIFGGAKTTVWVEAWDAASPMAPIWVLA